MGKFWASMESLIEDVGRFARHSDAVGSEHLMGELRALQLLSPTEACRMISVLGGDPCTAEATFSVWSPSADAMAHVGETCGKLRRFVDSVFAMRLREHRHAAAVAGAKQPASAIDVGFDEVLPHDFRDFKLSLRWEELEAAVGGVSALEELTAHVPIELGDFNEIKLRRCCARGQCINMHLDHSLRTVQVALNSDRTYDGGRLVYVSKHGSHVPERQAGTVTVHDNTIVHGVSRMGRGVRYGLFFLRTRSPVSVSPYP